MNNLAKSILVGLAAAVACFLLLKTIGKSNKQKYHVHFIVKAFKEPGWDNGMDEIMDQALPVVKRRLAQLDYDPSITRKDPDRFDIIIKHVTDTLLAAQTIESNNKLEFRELYTLPELENSFISITESKSTDSNKSVQRKITELIAFSVEQNGTAIPQPAIGVVLKKDTSLVNKILNDPEILKSFPRDIQFVFGAIQGPGRTKDKQTVLNIYASKMRMQEADLQKYIVKAEAGWSFNKQPELRFQFNEPGARIWERMTAQNKGRWLAIIIDNKVISAPHVNDAVYGGNCSISGGFEPEEIKLLARQLNAGFMPVHLSIVEQDISVEKSSPARKHLLISILVLLVVTGLSFFIFYSLNRR